MKKFMFPKRFWNEIGIGIETLLFQIGPFGIYKIGFENDVWTIMISRVHKHTNTIPSEDLPF